MTGVQWTSTVREELTLTRSPITPRGAVSCVRASTLVLDVQPTDVHVSTRNAWALHVSRPDRLTLQASGESWMTMPLWYRRYSTISPAAHDRHTPHARFIKYLTTILDYLTIMPKLRSTYDGRLIYKTSYEERQDFLMCNSLAKS